MSFFYIAPPPRKHNEVGYLLTVPSYGYPMGWGPENNEMLICSSTNLICSEHSV